MIINIEYANKIYDILVDIGANEKMRQSFVYTHTIDEDQHEWRFIGKLGFGGKFWNDYLYLKDKFMWKVSCYTEDETDERLELINETNKKLWELAEKEKLTRK